MGLREILDHVGSLFTRLSSVRPSSLWWRSAAVVHRLEWLRRTGQIINEDTEGSAAPGQGQRIAWIWLCPCGGCKGGLLRFPSGDEVARACPLKSKSFSTRVGSQRRRKRFHLHDWVKLDFWHPPTCALVFLSPSHGGKLMFCSVSSPGRSEVDLAAAGSKACGGFDSQLRVRSVAPALLVAVHGAEHGLQGWWRRWASLSSALPEWAKLLSSVSSSITISRRCTRRPGPDMCTDPPSYWTGTCMNWRFWTSRQSPPSPPAPVRYHKCAGTFLTSLESL